MSVRANAARVANLLGHIGREHTGEPVEAVVHILVLIEKIDPNLSSLLFELQTERRRETLQEVHALCGPSHPREHSALRVNPGKGEFQESGRDGLPGVYTHTFQAKRAGFCPDAIPIKREVPSRRGMRKTAVIRDRLSGKRPAIRCAPRRCQRRRDEPDPPITHLRTFSKTRGYRKTRAAPTRPSAPILHRQKASRKDQPTEHRKRRPPLTARRLSGLAAVRRPGQALHIFRLTTRRHPGDFRGTSRAIPQWSPGFAPRWCSRNAG